jgi:hypothetical protein
MSRRKNTTAAANGDVNADVLKMVRRELEASPKVDNDVLYKQAIAMDPAVGTLNGRQFNARYRLAALRLIIQDNPEQQERLARKAAKKTPRRVTESQDRAKEVLWDFAQDLLTADKGATVIILRNLDRYVERLVLT